MTLKRRWPNNAERARLDAIALSRKIVDLARPILDQVSMTETERVQRASRIMIEAKNIETALLDVVAQKLKAEPSTVGAADRSKRKD